MTNGLSSSSESLVRYISTLVVLGYFFCGYESSNGLLL